MYDGYVHRELKINQWDTTKLLRRVPNAALKLYHLRYPPVRIVQYVNHSELTQTE